MAISSTSALSYSELSFEYSTVFVTTEVEPAGGRSRQVRVLEEEDFRR
jgi:hypothetical protein